jgi:hypothetical protein
MPVAKEVARQNLVDTAEQLKQQHGLLLVERSAQDELKRAADSFESLAQPPALESYKRDFIGDWTLVCSTATNADGVDTTRLPSFAQDPIKKIRETISEAANKYLTVQQRIRSTNDDDVIDRIDHVLEYQPPAQLKELLDNLPPQLRSLNINPLEVSKSKLILVHKASIESEIPLFTKLSLTSIVLNVAGQSTSLDPDGKDVAGINLPLGEFINSGDFETTYMDETLRISRGKLGPVDQLRVFVRTDRQRQIEALMDIVETDVGMGVTSEMDVDEDKDPEFTTSNSQDEVVDDIGEEASTEDDVDSKSVLNDTMEEEIKALDEDKEGVDDDKGPPKDSSGKKS